MDTETTAGKLDKTEKHTKEAWQKVETEANELNMKQILKPMLFGLAIAGCYNFTDIGTVNNTGSFLKSATSTTYRVAFLAVILLYLCKCIAACFYLPTENITFNLQIIFWLVFAVCTSLAYFKSTSRKYGHHKQVFDFWMEDIIPDFKDLQIEYPKTTMERRTLIVFILSLILVFINTAVTGIQIYLSEENIFLSPFEIKPLTLAIFFVLQAVGSFIWVMPFATVVIFSTFLREAFNTVNQYGKRMYRQSGCTLAINFDKFRHLHLNLCKLVSDLDQDLGWYIAANFVFHVGCSAYAFYQIMCISMDIFVLLMYLFWFSGCTFIAAVTATYAARLHEAAHAPLDTIYYINVQDITVEKLAQLNLFLSKLTGTQVGFSTCGLLIITKEFILTIAGVFLTYFAVLYTL